MIYLHPQMDSECTNEIFVISELSIATYIYVHTYICIYIYVYIDVCNARFYVTSGNLLGSHLKFF